MQVRGKRQIVTAFQTRVLNPLVRRAIQRGWAPPGYALLETVGRRSGQPRRTPVGGGRHDGAFWIVAEHGRRAAYVRNIEANPSVRVLTGGRWHAGTAQLLPADDPVARQRRLSRLNAIAVRAVGTDLLTIRIDLEP
jgi:deazaflavin-dependent oxidoreductase (nitroreductase family)